MDRNQLRIPFDYPLNKDDSPIQTYGCRANNPDICANNSLPGICAFTSDDKICQKPSRAWKKQFAKLSEMEDA
ncbi:hypothetical protein [Butyrivibrio sp.]|uniref:hypothetical protein n=1 Tax=Butyrivibrio sp. TaxID=28121 RepID=UPI0025C6EFD4|nr:hypothetical protein [Butyrivibrio sp.]MBQ9304497.1 hypothetical protein [Butyrivibrio sp.]